MCAIQSFHPGKRSQKDSLKAQNDHDIHDEYMEDYNYNCTPSTCTGTVQKVNKIYIFFSILSISVSLFLR